MASLTSDTRFNASLFYRFSSWRGKAQIFP
jgi:hypothetical protein